MFWSKSWLSICIILLLEAVLFWQNVVPGTYLVGWDNVYPELNFSANVQRSVFSIWQEYRGLGVLDGMAHAANLMHTATLYVLSLILSQNLLRYVMTFSLHCIGGIGMFFLLRYLFSPRMNGLSFLRKRESRQETEWIPGQARDDRESLSLLPLLGALFYQYNLVTVQMFYTPLEVFSYHFAFLPLLLLLVLRYLEQGKKKTLFWFFLVSMISLPQAHVPPVFLAYALAVSIILLARLFPLFTKEVFDPELSRTGEGGSLLSGHVPTPPRLPFSKGEGSWGQRFRRSCVIVMLIFVANAYWGLPYVYTGLAGSKTIVNSKINQMSTDNVVFRNQAYGDFASVALLRGFSLDYIDFQLQGENDYMMKVWRDHSKYPPVFIISYLFFACTLWGAVQIVKKKETRFYPFLVLFGVTFLMLGSDIPVLSGFNKMLQEYVPLFYQAFRFTFTKFSILYGLCYTVLMMVGLRDLRMRFIFPVFFLALTIYAWPSFTGNFLYDNLRLEMPKSYGNMLDFFKKQDAHTRIATLPQPSYWGWQYYNWGARGSGFQWYGIPQPTLDGAFYPWSSQNENYYWEMSQAVYAHDTRALENVLKKYQINWIMVDRNIISPFSTRAVYVDSITQMIEQSRLITPASRYDSIVIYKVNLPNAPKEFVYVAHNPPVIGPDYAWNSKDEAFADIGTYIADTAATKRTLIKAPTSSADVYYPFRSLFTGRKQEEREFQIREEDDAFVVSTDIPQDLVGSTLQVGAPRPEESQEINATDLSTTNKYPEFRLDNEKLPIDFTSPGGQNIGLPYITHGTLEVRIPKIWGYTSYDSATDTNDWQQTPFSCDTFNKGSVMFESLVAQGMSLKRLSSMDASNCMDIDVSHAVQRLGYIVTVQSRHRSGDGVVFSVFNKTSMRQEIDTYLPLKSQLTPSYLVLPAMEEFGQGYTLQIRNSSIGRIETVNDIGRITMNPFPYTLLSSLRIVRPNKVIMPAKLVSGNSLTVSHPNPSYYQVIVDPVETQNLASLPSKNDVLVVSQAYDSAWKAYETQCAPGWSCTVKQWFPFFFFPENKQHVLVNNWENGWKLPPTTNLPAQAGHQPPTTLIIVYWPQYLEYLGFAVFGVGTVIGAIWLVFSRPKKHKLPN